MKVWAYSVATERWPWPYENEVRMWLVHNFGPNGDRWCNSYDHGLSSLEMDADVYNWYVLRWA